MSELSPDVGEFNKAEKRLLLKSSENIPTDFNSLENFFPFADYRDSRDVMAFVKGGSDIVTMPYETSYGRIESNKSRDLWVVAYRQKVKTENGEQEFGRLEINHARHKLFGGGQTIMSFRRLGDEYILAARENGSKTEIIKRGKVGSGLQSKDVPIGMLQNIANSLNDTAAVDFLVTPLSKIISSTK